MCSAKEGEFNSKWAIKVKTFSVFLSFVNETCVILKNPVKCHPFHEFKIYFSFITFDSYHKTSWFKCSTFYFVIWLFRELTALLHSCLDGWESTPPFVFINEESTQEELISSHFMWISEKPWEVDNSSPLYNTRESMAGRAHLQSF